MSRSKAGGMLRFTPVEYLADDQLPQLSLPSEPVVQLLYLCQGDKVQNRCVWFQCFKGTILGHKLWRIIWDDLLWYNLKRAKLSRSNAVVLLDVVVVIVNTTGHLECALVSTNYKSIFPFTIPAKSIWRHFYGVASHSQGCKGALGEEFLFSWQGLQAFMQFSLSRSDSDHPTWLRVIDFAPIAPG